MEYKEQISRLEKLADHWKELATAFADSAHDQHKAKGEDVLRDEIWGAFDNLRSTFEDKGGVPDIVAQLAEHAFWARVAVLMPESQEP